MSGWFRLYDAVLDDPKVQRLPAEMFRGWVNLLCLANRNDGVIPDVQHAAFALRMSESSANKLLNYLVDCGLMDKDETAITPHNWNGRQYKGDVSTDRVRRFRKRKETVTETPPEQNRTEQNRTETDRTRKRPAFTPPKIEEVIAYCQERGNHVNPRTWYDHYSANGWRVGKNKMVDWRAAVRTWETNGGRNGSGATESRGKRVADKLTDIARRDIEERGIAETLGGGAVQETPGEVPAQVGERNRGH